MKILIAEDDPLTLKMMTNLMEDWGYETVPVSSGNAAWEVFQQKDAPSLAVLDWHMPGFRGDELCRKLRSEMAHKPCYLILITAKNTRAEDRVEGLNAGADDYLPKPFDLPELRARLQVGERVLKLQVELSNRVQELENLLSQIQQLRGLLPICVHCKRIRDDKNYWHSVETYIAHHSGAEFTHGICPSCLDEQMKDFQKHA
jgi:DNA-binding response OmpR family regulator